MKLKAKKVLAVLLTLALVLGIIPGMSLVGTVYAADSESSPYLRYETNYAYGAGSYRIWGTLNGVEKQTTYADAGWRIRFQDASGASANIGQIANGVERIITVGSVQYGFTLNLSLVNNGRYVKVEFVIRNPSSSPQTYSVGSGADVQIGNDDYADIFQFPDGSGFYMVENPFYGGEGAQFNFICKNAYGVTDVDTFWFGHYGYVESQMFNQVSSTSLTNTDSGMAFSWQDRTLAPGATNKHSILIGIGPVNAQPTVTLTGLFAPDSTLPDVLAGDSYTVTGTVSDPEGTAGTELYYVIDDGTPVRFHTFPGAPGDFTGTIQIPYGLSPGTHTITIYAQDTDGAISSAIQKPFTVCALTVTGHDLTYIGGQGPTYLDPDFIVDYPGTITGGKVYIESNFNRYTDTLYFSNVNGITGNYVSTTGVLTMTGEGTAEDYQAFIRNISFYSTAAYGTRTVVVVLYSDTGNVVYFSGTGHYYEYVAAPGMTWTAAKAAAEARTYQGLTGYLTTITSAAENAFVADKCAGDGWLGASDAGHDKEWYWVTGPEAGNKFCHQMPYPGGVSYTVAGWYQNFASGEPNDAPYGYAGNEDYLHMYADSGAWNDYANDNPNIHGYLVEYGDEPLPPNDAIAVINVTIVDATPPTIHNVFGNPTSWTNGDVTLTVSASDDGSGLHAEGAYSFNNGEWTNSPSQIFTTNQIVNIRVRDNSGNIVSQAVLIDKIDKEAPTFSYISHSPLTWTAGPVTLTVHGLTDNGGVGLHASPYSFSTTEGVYNWQSSDTSPGFYENGIVYLYVRDAFGNISQASTVVINNLDTTLPNAPVINGADAYTFSHWYNTDRTVTASFTPTQGCDEWLQYQVDDGPWTDGSAVTISAPGIHTVRFRVMDELGRTGSLQSCTVQIDKQPPTVTAVDQDYAWRNSNFLIPIQFSDGGGAGLYAIQYALTNSTTTPSSWTNATISQMVSVTEEGMWYIHYKAEDTAGNTQTGYFGPYRLDKTDPTGSVTIIPTKPYSGIRFAWDANVILLLTAEDALSGPYSMRFAESPEALALASFYLAQPLHPFTISAGDGLKTVYFQLMDNAGNLSPVYSDMVYLDTTKPTLTISPPSQYVAKSGDVIQYTVTFDDNSKTFGHSGIAENNGIDAITLHAPDVVLSAFGTIDVNDILVLVEPVPGQPLQRRIRLILPDDMQGEGSLTLKIAAGAAQDKAGNYSAETLYNFFVNIDNIPPANQDQLFSGSIRVQGGSNITLNGSSLAFGGNASDSIVFAPANYGGQPANVNTITSTTGASGNINAPLAEGVYYLYVVDSAGNISPASVAALVVDNTGPEVTISEPDNTVIKADGQINYTVTFAEDTDLESIATLFTKSKISLHTTGTANAHVNILDVPGNPYQKIVRLSNFSGDGMINGITIGADICRDEVGNGSLAVTQPVGLLVDCTNPTAPSVTFETINDGPLAKIVNFITFGYFCNEEIEVTLHAGDGGSGLSKIYYKTDPEADYTEAIPNEAGDVVFTLPVGFKGYVYAYAEDAAGNISFTVQSDGIIIENSAPVIQVAPVDVSGWFTADQTLTVNITDNEGLKEITYSVNGVVTTVDLVDGYTDKQDAYSFSIPLTEDSTGHIIQINVMDLAGNVAATYNATVKLDKTAPEISGVAGNPTDWTGNDVTLTVNASDATSGLAALAYSFDDGATWQAENSKTFTENTAEIIIKVKDAAGNIQTYEPISITKIDKTLPEVAVIASPENYGEDIWHTTDQTVTATFTPTPGCPEKLQYKVDDGQWTDGEAVTISEEGRHTVTFRVVDTLGRASAAQTVPVNLDKTVPTNLQVKYGTNPFKTFLSTLTFGLFFNDTVTVTLTAEDVTSGVKEFTYTLSGQSSKTVAASNGTATFTIEPQFKGNFTVIVKDNAGNSTASQAYEHLAVDSQAPNKPVIDSGSYTPGSWTAENVTLTVSGSTALSGIAKYQYTVTAGATLSGSESWTDITGTNGTVTITDATATAPANVTAASITATQTGNVYYHFRAVSKSGVVGPAQAIQVKIDKVTPSISVNANGYDGSWTKNTVRFDFSNSASNLSGVSYYYTTSSTGNWTPITGTSLEITADTNATYIFKAVSGAGLEHVSTNYTVRVQKSAPQNATVAVAPANASGENGWYKGTKPTISVTAPTVSGTAPVTVKYKLWTGDEPAEGTELTGNPPVIDTDGIWNLKVWTEDEAGNKSQEQVKTIKVDTTAPTGTIQVKDNPFKQFVNTITFGLFFKETVDISLAADEDLSGIAKIAYYKSASELTQAQLEALPAGDWTTGTSLSVTAGEKFVLYTRITDNAGNISIINTQGVVVYTDSTIPEDSAYFDTDTTRDGYKDITVDLELNGNTVESVKLGDTTLQKDVDYTVDGNTVTLKKEYLQTVVDETITFTFSFAPMGEPFEEGTSIGDPPGTKTFTIIQLFHAAEPVFETNLSGSKIYTKGDGAETLQVEAISTDDGSISYQWYVNGQAIDGATEASYTPSTDKTGAYDYYVVATNTNTTVNGEQTATTQSGTYRVVVNNLVVNQPDLAEDAPKTEIQEDEQAILDAALTEEDKEKLEEGYEIAINVQVQTVVEPSQDEEKAVFQIIGDNELGQYIDISLIKILIDAEGNKSEEKISQLNKPLTITIQIPEELLPKDGEVRKFSIVRVHNGVATILEDLDDVLETITIQTDSFSTYAIVYTVEKTSELPDTGDKSPVSAFAMAVASLLLLAIIPKRRRKAAGK